MSVVVVRRDRLEQYESLGMVTVREDADCPYPLVGAVNEPLPFDEEDDDGDTR